MKILRALGIAFSLLVPVAAFATPSIHTCCDSSCCVPGCPFCSMNH